VYQKTIADQISIRQIRTPLTKSKEFKALKKHFSNLKNTTISKLFSKDKNRVRDFVLNIDDFRVDFSKNIVDRKAIKLLVDLARARGLEQSIKDMFEGKKINWTEKRAVGHVAVRNRSNTPYLVDGKDVMPEVNGVLNLMESFVNEVHSGEWRGYSGKKIKYIVNIGIGGSDLGPKTAVQALRPYQVDGIETIFISNVDGADIAEKLKHVNPEETLFLIASKTFTTQETMANANTAKKWLVDHYKNLGEDAIYKFDKSGEMSLWPKEKTEKLFVSKHFVAMSTAKTEVEKFGIDSKNMFPFWDWVGGRYSLWSAIGLSIALSVGFKNFKEMLEGAHKMDQHFLNTPLEKNIPVIMGLIRILYNNFFDYPFHAIHPYDQNLESFHSHIQQVDMESLGKGVNSQNIKVDYATGQVITGGAGTNLQHADYQLKHQGRTVPMDFIAARDTHYPELSHHHEMLISNFIAQTESLAFGKSLKAVIKELKAEGKYTDEEIIALAPHKVFEGNRPTNSITYDKLTPTNVGMLFSLYEQIVATDAFVLGLNAFDQFGVELGKVQAKKILNELKDETLELNHDPSTNGLIKVMRKPKATKENGKDRRN